MRKSSRRGEKQQHQATAQKAASNQKRKQIPSEQPSKLDLMIKMLSRQEGANITELAELTGWQKHSIRGAIAGTLKKKGFAIRSEPGEGGRRYRIEAAG